MSASFHPKNLANFFKNTTRRYAARLGMITLVFAILFGACRPKPVVPTVEPPADTEEASVRIPTQTPAVVDSGFEVIDDGSPLPPQIIDRQPRGAQELSLDGDISLTFDQAMDQERTADAWFVLGPEGERVEGSLSWPSSRTLNFQPTQKLHTGSLYQANLGDEAISLAGVSLKDSYSFQFITVGELQVSQVFPAHNAKDVANDAVITVIFNRPVVPLTIAEEKDSLPEPITIQPSISGSGEWVNTSVYAYQPDKPLKGGTTYKVEVHAGLEDAAGETRLVDGYTWIFNTIRPSIRSLELTSGASNPDDNYSHVHIDEAFKILFYQPMDIPSSEAALRLESHSGENVTLITEWNEDATQIWITPTQQLAMETSYILQLGSQAQSADGGKLIDGLDWNFTTVLYPAVRYVLPADGTVQSSFSSELQIAFESPMNFETVKERVQITPEPESEYQWWYNEWDWKVIAYVLKPSTDYQVRLLPGMEDIYGNPIQDVTTVRFTTGPYAPSAGLKMPYRPSVFRDSVEHEIYYSHRNVESLQMRLFSQKADQFMSLVSGKTSPHKYLPSDSDLVWQVDGLKGGDLNQRVLESVRPRTASGEPLSLGFYFLGLNAEGVDQENPFVDRRFFMVANANLTFKSTTTEAMIWLTDLTTGEPLEAVPVTIFGDDFQAIGQGTTDEDGLLRLVLPEPPDPYDNRYALADDGRVFAFAASQWDSGVPLYDYGIWGSYYAPANQPKAYVYTERPIYRPGQPVYFKGIVRLDDDLDYSLPDHNQVNITISDYQETIYKDSLPLSPHGSFSGEFTLDQETTLGYYTLEVRLPGRDEVIGSVSFNVAEYRKPEFQVFVAVEPENVLSGDNFNARIQADYYSGGGVAEAKVNWTLSAESYRFQPPDEYSGYSFEDIERDVYFFGDYWESSSEIIAEGQSQTDENGRLTLTLPVDLSEAKTGQLLTFEASITDVAGSSVSGRASLIAHQSMVYPGVQPGSYVGKAGDEQTFEIVALDWNGSPLPNQRVDVEIVERRWYSVQEQDATGRVQWKVTVEEIPVENFSDLILDEQGEGEVTFVPPNGGVFQAQVTALDENGNLGQASGYMWVAGENYIPWRQTNDRSFELVTDRRNYTPGDTAEILIASPFQGEAYALVTVERGHIHHQEVLHLTTNSTVYELPITPGMAPNVYISVLIIKGVDDDHPRPDFKMGIAEIKVDTQQQELVIELEPDRAEAGPGEQVLYTVRTSDADGNPVRAEVSLGLSDLATLSLMPPNSPPILDYFYSNRTLGVWTIVPLALNIEDYNAEIADEAADDLPGSSGGGKGIDELGVIEVRQDFPDTAFWDAHVVTGENGEAAVAVNLPDNLTTWRMDARAVSMDTRVGQTTIDLVSTKPLLVRPQTPRFFIAGDLARLGTAVHNNTDQPLNVDVNLTAEGLTLQDPASQAVEVAAHSQVYVAWDVVVAGDARRVDLVFSAESGDLQDASRPPMGTLDNQGIPVYRYEARETVGTSGQMTAGGTRVEAISLPQAFQVSEGELTIKVAPSLAAGMTDGLTYLLHYPYECIEQTISRFLPNVITTRALKSARLSDPAMEAGLQIQVDTALQRLYNWQNPDGGFGWWSKDESDPVTSAYVLLGLIEAQGAGYQVSMSVLERGLDYLRTQIVSVTRLSEPYLLNRQVFILYVLARAGQPDVSKTVQIYAQRQAMALYARAFLAQTLFLIDAEDPRLDTLLSDFNNAAILSATGSHWEEESFDRWNWNTDTRSTAIILSTLSQIDPQNPLNANAVRWLMSNRTNGHWNGTQETAWTLMALTNWMVASGELGANYQYAVALNGERLGGGVANAETLRQNLILRVDVSDLLREEANRLAIARDDGTGNLYYTAHLDVSLPVEQVQALDQGIVVSRSYYDLDNPDQPIMEAKQGDLLMARLTVVAPNALHYLVVDDPLPAGLETVDQSLDTSVQSVQLDQEITLEDIFWRGWGWWYFKQIQLRDEKVVLSTNYLPAGTYIYNYLVRAATAGTFQVIPPTAQEFYFPEVYGRGEGSLFEVLP